MKKFKKLIKGFTLVELLVVITIGALMVGMGMIQINSFLNTQRVNSQNSEVLSVVRLAKNYAVTMQSPAGYTQPVNYIAIEITSGGRMRISPGNNISGISVGTTYLEKNLDLKYTEVTPVVFGDIVFGIPDGKLMMLVGNQAVPRPNDYSYNIMVRSSQDTTKTNGVLIKSSGVVEERANVLGIVPTNATSGDFVGAESTATSAPTQAPTATGILGNPTTPTPTPTTFVCRNTGVSCTLSWQCCIGECISNVCATCRPPGMDCRADTDCCSNICSLGICQADTSQECTVPQTNPHVEEINGSCVEINSCGFNAQGC